MDDTKKMLRAIINGQSALKSELLQEIGKLEKKVDKGFDGVNERFEEVDKQFVGVNKRLDMIGKSVAYLEDDAPTREEHDKLGKRVTKIEGKRASA